MDEETFLRAISAAPDDITIRLVYADWLEERGDPRAEYVRIQSQLRILPADDKTRLSFQLREKELRADFPHYWLAKLDPPVWCMVGNIVDIRPSNSDETIRRGTRLFRPNSKIYLATLRNSYALWDPERYRSDSIEIIGQHRKSREWIGSWVTMSATTNWRVRLIHHPGALVRLREAEWPGFALRENAFQCPEDKDSLEAVRALLEAIRTSVRS